MIAEQRGMGVWVANEEFKTELMGRERLCLELRCPYEGCRKPFIVDKKTWYNSKVSSVLTRPCPYCFRTAWLDDYQARVVAEGYLEGRRQAHGVEPPAFSDRAKLPADRTDRRGK